MELSKSLSFSSFIASTFSFPKARKSGHLHHYPMPFSTLLQGVGVVGASTSAAARPPPAVAMEKKPPRPQREQPLACPRCNSSNTKFCYYNNYSLAQPRYFCKACKRYWTHGGTLRNVPVGGGSRRSKRAPPPPPPLLPISAASPPKRVVHFPEPTMQNPGLIHEGFGLVNLSGIFHAGAPWSSFMAVGGGGGGYGHYGGSTTTATMEEGGGGGGFWINGGGS